MDIQEIIRRVRAGQSDRAIHEDLGVHRNTVKKYRQWVEQHSLLEGELPDLESLQRKAGHNLTPALTAAERVECRTVSRGG
jgi:DNA-binding CsgD family transcriptional regulator